MKDYTNKSRKNQKLASIITSTEYNSANFKAERNHYICSLRAQGYTYAEIQEEVLKKYGERIIKQRVGEIIRDYKKKFQEGGLL